MKKLLLLLALLTIPTTHAFTGNITGNITGYFNTTTGEAINLTISGMLTTLKILWDKDFGGDLMAQFLLFFVVMMFGFLALAEWKKEAEYFVIAGLFTAALAYYVMTHQVFEVFYNRIAYLLLFLLAVFFTIIKPIDLLTKKGGKRKK